MNHNNEKKSGSFYESYKKHEKAWNMLLLLIIVIAFASYFVYVVFTDSERIKPNELIAKFILGFISYWAITAFLEKKSK